MKKIKNPVTVLDHLTNRMIDDHNMKEKEQPKDESKEDEFIELDVPIKTPLWEDDETKEVKEGGELFTGGEWFVDAGDFDRLQDAGEILVRSEDGDERFDICNFGCDETGKAKANALLIAQSKNMYYALKGMLKQFDHEGNRHPDSIKAREFAREVFQKATPKK